LAAREKLDEVAQNWPLGKAPVAVQLETVQVAPEKNPVVHFVEHHVVGVDVF